MIIADGVVEIAIAATGVKSLASLQHVSTWNQHKGEVAKLTPPNTNKPMTGVRTPRCSNYIQIKQHGTQRTHRCILSYRKNSKKLDMRAFLHAR